MHHQVGSLQFDNLCVVFVVSNSLVSLVFIYLLLYSTSAEGL